MAGFLRAITINKKNYETKCKKKIARVCHSVSLLYENIIHPSDFNFSTPIHQ